jgi:hemerythrin
MAFFEWKADYSVKVAAIDAQHKKLVGMLNDLYTALKAGEGREALEKILADLVDYTKTHFAAEERLMQANGYPGYLEHKDKHEKMAAKVLDYIKKYHANEINSPIEISNFLKDWLKKHIMSTDKAYGPFLNEKGIR